MKNIEKLWAFEGYTIRPLKKEDIEMYYELNFNPLDTEVARMTGSATHFEKDVIVKHLERCIADEERYDFVIVDPKGNIIGETVINDIDIDLNSANFRIGIFQEVERGKGIGQWALSTTIDFAFRDLKLNRLELDVYEFNEKGHHIYKKAGFIEEGVLREAVKDNGVYYNVILMSMLRSDWEKSYQ